MGNMVSSVPVVTSCRGQARVNEPISCADSLAGKPEDRSGGPIASASEVASFESPDSRDTKGFRNLRERERGRVERTISFGEERRFVRPRNVLFSFREEAWEASRCNFDGEADEESRKSRCRGVASFSARNSRREGSDTIVYALFTATGS